MKRVAIALLLLLAACATPAPTQLAQVVAPTAQVTACVTVGPSSAGIIQECIAAYVTNTPTATATATNTATPTPTPTLAPTATLTPTNAVQLVPWHAPGSHLDPITHRPLNIHEHGAPPPQWVLDSGHTPFIQTRESHVGYKGMYAPSDKGSKGVESYLITHILSTVAAASHGDHDFQLWVKTPGTGAVSYWAGLLDFGTPPITRTVDTGERPIILSKPGTMCQTWYQAPGRLVFDMGWTICGEYQTIQGVTLGGNGSYRSADWVIYVSRLSEFPGGDPDLAKFCTDDGFGHCRLSWLVTGAQYDQTGVVPIN